MVNKSLENNQKMKNYIIKNSEAIKEQLVAYFYDKPVHILKHFNRSINFNSALAQIENLVPKDLASNIDGIYVGEFNDIHKKNRKVNAIYKDGAIYVSNEQDNEDDLIDDIIHEIAHAVEEQHQDLIYGDEDLESEFLAKRKTLYYLLDDNKEKHLIHFLDPDYNLNFDMFLYKTLGYDYLRTASASLFYSPYAITSLREYWANGFENYFLGDKQKLKELSPVLYNKIKSLVEEDAGEKDNEWTQ